MCTAQWAHTVCSVNIRCVSGSQRLPFQNGAQPTLLKWADWITLRSRVLTVIGYHETTGNIWEHFPRNCRDETSTVVVTTLQYSSSTALLHYTAFNSSRKWTLPVSPSHVTRSSNQFLTVRQQISNHVIVTWPPRDHHVTTTCWSREQLDMLCMVECVARMKDNLILVARDVMGDPLVCLPH